MENKYLSLYKKYNKKLLDNRLFKGGRSNYYNKYMNAGYTLDGSYSNYNDTDYDYFNQIMTINCGEECTPTPDQLTPDLIEKSKYWGTRPDIERKIKNIDNVNKEWLVDHWIYANNFYKVNLIIILLEDLYNINQSEDIVDVAIEFLLYNSCSGLIPGENQIVGKNFLNIARKLRENPRIKEYLDKIRFATDNKADELCSTNRYNKTNYGKIYNGGLYNKYNGNQRIVNNHHILYNYYSKRY